MQMKIKQWLSKQKENIKKKIDNKLEERKELKAIYQETLMKEKKRFAKEKTLIKTNEMIRRAKERVENPHLKALGKIIVKGSKGITKELSKLSVGHTGGFGDDMFAGLPKSKGIKLKGEITRGAKKQIEKKGSKIASIDDINRGLGF